MADEPSFDPGYGVLAISGIGSPLFTKLLSRMVFSTTTSYALMRAFIRKENVDKIQMRFRYRPGEPYRDAL